MSRCKKGKVRLDVSRSSRRISGVGLVTMLMRRVLSRLAWAWMSAVGTSWGAKHIHVSAHRFSASDGFKKPSLVLVTGWRSASVNCQLTTSKLQ